jgi:hypothetical protein
MAAILIVIDLRYDIKIMTLSWCALLEDFTQRRKDSQKNNLSLQRYFLISYLVFLISVMNTICAKLSETCVDHATSSRRDDWWVVRNDDRTKRSEGTSGAHLD